MLSRKKIVLAAGAALIVVLTFAGAAVWALVALTPPSEVRSEEPTSHGAPSPVPVSDAAGRAAIVAAATVAHFEGSDTKAQRAREYQKAGLTPELAEAFSPVWLTVFDDPAVGSAHVDATGDTFVSAAVAVDGDPQIGVATAAEGHGAHAIRVPVTITCVPQYASQTGNPIVAAPLTATWHAVVDEATQQVLEVDQPAPADLPVRFVRE